MPDKKTTSCPKTDPCPDDELSWQNDDDFFDNEFNTEHSFDETQEDDTYGDSQYTDEEYEDNYYDENALPEQYDEVSEEDYNEDFEEDSNKDFVEDLLDEPLDMPYQNNYSKRHSVKKTTDANRPWWKYVLNFHVFFAVFAVFIVVTLILFFKHWGVQIKPEDIDKIAPEADGRDAFDVIMPHLDENGNVLANKSPHTILFFGNSPFADDRDSENNVVNMISKRIGATVYNVSVRDSLLASQSYAVMSDTSGLDVYNFYWMCIYLTWDEYLEYWDSIENNPNFNLLPETKEVHHTLDTIDMSTVDTICIMYDASDYLAGSIFYNEENETDIRSFSGNLLAGIEVLQKKYPHIRIIVISPTYAYGIDDNGEYISSDIKVYGEGATLSSYVIKECETVGSRGISFIDNIYGTFNEDEAAEYLTDNLHLNQKGREKLVRRICSFITRFDEK